MQEGGRFCPVYSRPAEPSVSQPRQLRRTRAITVAAVLFALCGMGEILAGVLLLGFATLALPVPKIGWLFAPFLDTVGAGILVVGVARIVAAKLLWGCTKVGGVLAAVLAIAGFVVSMPVLPVALLEILLAVILLAPVARGWSSLRWSS